MHPHSGAVRPNYSAVSLIGMVSLDTIIIIIIIVQHLALTANFKWFVTFCPSILAAAIRPVLQYTSHVFPHLLVLQSQFLHSIWLSEWNCLQHRDYVASMVPSKVEAMCAHCIFGMNMYNITPANCFKVVSNHVSYFVTLHDYSQSFTSQFCFLCTQHYEGESEAQAIFST